MAYLEVPKSERERYIHVAAIEIVISEGCKNICVAGYQEPPHSTAHLAAKTYKIKRFCIWQTINTLNCWIKQERITIQIQRYEHLRYRAVVGQGLLGGIRKNLSNVPLVEAPQWLQGRAKRHPLGQKSYQERTTTVREHCNLTCFQSRSPRAHVPALRRRRRSKPMSMMTSKTKCVTSMEMKVGMLPLRSGILQNPNTGSHTARI
jgi:hypothetical protein